MFLVVGLGGAALLVVFLVFDDLLEGVLPEADWISGPIIGAFVAAFGITGWIASEGFDAPGWLASLVGIGGGFALAWLAGRVIKSLLHSPTDGTPTSASLVGREGRVVTNAAPGQLGEVLVSIGGQPVKLTAVSEDALTRGSSVVVIDTTSPTKVVVQLADRFWAANSTSPPS